MLAADTIWTGASGVVIAALVLWGLLRWRGRSKDKGTGSGKGK